MPRHERDRERAAGRGRVLPALGPAGVPARPRAGGGAAPPGRHPARPAGRLRAGPGAPGGAGAGRPARGPAHALRARHRPRLPLQSVRPEPEIAFETLERDEDVAVLLEAARPHLGQDGGPLLHATHLCRAGGTERLFLAGPLCSLDRHSLALLAQDLEALLAGRAAGRDEALQYADYALWQAELLEGEAGRQGRAFWRELTRGHAACSRRCRSSGRAAPVRPAGPRCGATACRPGSPTRRGISAPPPTGCCCSCGRRSSAVSWACRSFWAASPSMAAARRWPRPRGRSPGFCRSRPTSGRSSPCVRAGRGSETASSAASCGRTA